MGSRDTRLLLSGRLVSGVPQSPATTCQVSLRASRPPISCLQSLKLNSRAGHPEPQELDTPSLWGDMQRGCWGRVGPDNLKSS